MTAKNTNLIWVKRKSLNVSFLLKSENNEIARCGAKLNWLESGFIFKDCTWAHERIYFLVRLRNLWSQPRMG
jgi:hypothetical protein